MGVVAHTGDSSTGEVKIDHHELEATQRGQGQLERHRKTVSQNET